MDCRIINHKMLREKRSKTMWEYHVESGDGSQGPRHERKVWPGGKKYNLVKPDVMQGHHFIAHRMARSADGVKRYRGSGENGVYRGN